MWWGFLAGSVALAIAEAVLSSDRSAAAAQASTNWFVHGLQRLLSADVAGIPQLKSAQAVPWQQGAPAQGRKLTGTADTSPPAMPPRGAITI